MARARYATVIRRYRISDDVLMRILEFLDPRSLFLACKAFKRVYAHAMQYHHLRYKFELAVSGMRDGSAPGVAAPLLMRLHLLLSYRTDWPRLNWTHEYKIQAITPSQISTSGGFIHQIRPHGAYSTLELTELPSCRTGRSPALMRRLRFTSPPIETICIDSSLGLIIAAHIFCQGGRVGVQFHIRDLWTFGKHPRARAESYELPTQSTAPVSRAVLSISGSKMAMTLEFVGGKINHLLMDWRNFGARWVDDQDILLLDEDFVLVLCKKGSSPPILNLCSISNLANMAVLRQYELPGTWNLSSIQFQPNSAPHLPSSNALFYSDPANRILAISAKLASRSSSSSQRSWLFINENYFKGAPFRREPIAVPWSVWGQYCAMKDLPRSKALVHGPYPVGSKVVFVESDSGHRSSATPSLNVIEFAPFPDAPPRLDQSWSMVGARSALFPTETARRLPSSAVEHYAVDNIGVTEDNIVLFLEAQPGFRPVNVLTFGAPSQPQR